jgi:hypothetical protein
MRRIQPDPDLLRRPAREIQMSGSRWMLLAGGGINLAVAALHLALGFAGEAVERFFGAPAWVLRLVREGRFQLILLCLTMAALFALCGLYGFSGAGRIRRLPFLRTVLILVGAIYTLRGLSVIRDLRWAIAAPSLHSSHFLVFSLVALGTGLMYLIGTMANWNNVGSRLR